MEIKHGTSPVSLDRRDYSHPVFGDAFVKFPTDFNVDIGRTMRDQNAEGLPYGCSGETQTDIAVDQDNTIYKPAYLYDKTCFDEGHDTNQGCQIRSSLKAARIYGVQALAETTDQEAETHRRGAYFNIYDTGGRDWFDAFRLALMTNKQGISVGTPWFTEWSVPVNGVLPQSFIYNGPQNHSWHNWAIKGWKDINGTPYLLGKTWQGPDYGDKGWAYFPRETINAVMQISGTAAFTQSKLTPGDIKPIQIDIWELIMIFLARIKLLAPRLN